MKNNLIKKFYETRYLKFFMETSLGKQIFIDLVPKDLHSEEPDFLFFNIKTNQIIGLEVVNLINCSEKQKATAKLNKIVRNVCLMLNDYTSLRYCVFLSCNDGNYESINIKANDFTNKIFELIINDKNLKLKETKYKTFYLSDNNKLYLSYSLNEENYNFPGLPDGGIIKNNPFDLLENAISSKNKKLKKYREKCDKCILLIVSDNLAGNNSFLNFDTDLNNKVFESNFDKIFLYEFGGIIHSNSRKININHLS